MGNILNKQTKRLKGGKLGVKKGRERVLGPWFLWLFTIFTLIIFVKSPSLWVPIIKMKCQ